MFEYIASFSNSTLLFLISLTVLAFILVDRRIILYRFAVAANLIENLSHQATFQIIHSEFHKRGDKISEQELDICLSVMVNKGLLYFYHVGKEQSGYFVLTSEGVDFLREKRVQGLK